jgi:hypothetical protein
MTTIDLQHKTRPNTGSIEHYWFENKHIGLKRTRFHRIIVPLEPFDSGLDHVRQPEATKLVIEWIPLGLDDPAALDGVEISMAAMPDVEASIYLGGAHNWYDVERLALKRHGDGYTATCAGVVDFDSEGAAESERFDFTVELVYRGEASA